MLVRHNFNLKLFNTFSVDVCARYAVFIYNEYKLFQFWRRYYSDSDQILVLGNGSNVLFLENYVGTILLNRIKGIFVTENNKEWKLHVGAGEIWNELVIFTVRKNIPGLENLACIPGTVGAASVQNIGAYGIEFSQICEYVDVFDRNKQKKIRFTVFECKFSYRDSVFKNFPNKYIVLYVGFRLKKNWKPILKHYELSNLNFFQITPNKIYHIVCYIRKSKLPNPTIFGNAGSFFKNPIVDIDVVYPLLNKYPNMPYCCQLNGKIKLSAGWLVEHCQLKGYVLGEASVYVKQSLVLINRRQIATGIEIAALALYIYRQVFNKFNICLRPEVRLIGCYGEIDPNYLF